MRVQSYACAASPTLATNQNRRRFARQHSKLKSARSALMSRYVGMLGQAFEAAGPPRSNRYAGRKFFEQVWFGCFNSPCLPLVSAASWPSAAGPARARHHPGVLVLKCDTLGAELLKCGGPLRSRTPGCSPCFLFRGSATPFSSCPVRARCVVLVRLFEDPASSTRATTQYCHLARQQRTSDASSSANQMARLFRRKVSRSDDCPGSLSIVRAAEWAASSSRLQLLARAAFMTKIATTRKGRIFVTFGLY